MVEQDDSAGFAILSLPILQPENQMWFRAHNLMWNKLTTFQDTHDQESNTPSVRLAKYRDRGFLLCLVRETNKEQ